MATLADMLGIAGYAIEAVGVLTILVGFILSAIWFVARLGQAEGLAAFERFRQDLARSIILGLEFLIAGDIIRTVTVKQTITSATVLALIVLIRVVLGLMLEIEISGQWPWRRRKED